MATSLEEMQFEILPAEEAESGVVFGIGADVSINDGGFDPGDGEILTQDSTNTQNGATNFGRDRRTGQTWTWQGHINRDDVENGLETWGDFESAWRALEVAQEPSAVLSLRYRVGGRYRRVFGRPRRLKGSPSNLLIQGYMPLTFDFKKSDSLYYDDELSQVVIPYAADSSGGFTLPSTLPIHTIPGGQREGVINVGGNTPTYPVIRINGPITAPFVYTANWRVDLPTLNLLEGDHVEIDLRPWHLTVLNSSGGSLAGKMARRQWLSDIVLTPGNHEITFGGSTGGSPTCTVSWRSAWNSL